MSHFVYILHSVKLNRFYIGSTSDYDVRIQFHIHAPPHKFTANAKDWLLYLKIVCTTRKQALLIEGHIKSMKSKVYIENLKKYPEMVEKLLFRYLN